MLYKVKTAKSRYTFEEKSKLEKLGLKFYEDNNEIYKDKCRMYRKKYGRKDVYINGKVRINTLEELQSFIKEWGPIVINKDSICIYDGWLE